MPICPPQLPSSVGAAGAVAADGAAISRLDRPMNAALTALLDAAFGGATHPLAAWYAGLLAGAPALHAFTEANAAKIRKKTRLARDPEAQRDLRCELAVAAALVDRRSPLTYEPLAGEGRRGPDFLLRHKGHTDVYVEVSRLRPARSEERDPLDRLAAALCGKLGQLVPGAANLLVLVSDADRYGAEAIRETFLALRRRADARDDAYFAFRGLAGARAFLQGLPRLSALLAVMPASPEVTLSPMQQARHPLPADLARAIARWDLAAVIGPAP
jgi:hypothetical protein